MSAPFTYEALPPADIEFVPLKQTQSFKADALLEASHQPAVQRAYLFMTASCALLLLFLCTDRPWLR